MRLVSLAGMVVILAVAWALSRARREVRWRTVLWGLGLQFLLATIILRDDLWGRLGIVALAALLVLYGARRVAAMGRSASAALVLAAAVVAAGAAGRDPAWPLAAAGLLVVLLVAGARLQLDSRVRALLGSAVIAMGAAWIFATGLSGRELFSRAGRGITDLLQLAEYGARFLFGNLAVERYFFPPGDAGWPGFGYQFAFKLLPIIVFFGALMAVLYYLGWVQAVVAAVARFMRWTMGTGGAETLCAANNIFIGQTEAPLVIKPYLAAMSRSEVMSVMVAGFATIAGGSLAAYLALGIPADHLLAASVMSAPAALVVAKILVPQGAAGAVATDRLAPVHTGDNLIEAATIGIIDGTRLAVNVGAMLIGFIALIAVVDVSLNALDTLIDGRLLGGVAIERAAAGFSPVTREHVGFFPGSLQTLFGTALAPVAWLLGIPWSEAARVGHLLGIMASLNEFVAFSSLAMMIQAETLSHRSVVLATYALCGFANFGSIGIQIGGLSALAPGRKADFARLGLQAMVGGLLASWLTATVAGVLIP